jgi:hypothetical protein
MHEVPTAASAWVHSSGIAAASHRSAPQHCTRVTRCRAQGKSYPPKFGEGDTVNLELNKDTREVKMWINDKAPFTIGGIDPAAKFFVNMEGEQSAIEIVRIN